MYQTNGFGGGGWHTYGNDITVDHKTYPGESFIGTETGATMTDVRHIAGQSWFATNAYYTVGIGWTQFVSTSPSSALILNPATGAVTSATAPANSPTPIVWTYTNLGVSTSGGTGILNIQNYYEAGDPDYSAAFTRAIEYGQSLNRPFAIFMPDGQYNLGLNNPTPVPILSNMAIIGESRVGTIINGLRTDGYPLFYSFNTSVSNFEVRNLTVDGKTNWISFFMMRSIITGPTYKNITFDNLELRNLGTPGNTNFGINGNHAIQLSGNNGLFYGCLGSNLQITNVYMHDCHCWEYEPITYNGIDGVIFANNQIIDNNTVAPPPPSFQTAAVSNYIYCENVMIANNHFENNGYDLILFAGQNIVLTNNTFNNSNNYSVVNPQTSIRIANAQYIFFEHNNTWNITGPANTGNAICLFDYSGSLDLNGNICPNSNNITLDGVVSGNYYQAFVVPSNTVSTSNAAQSYITLRGHFTGFSSSAINLQGSYLGTGYLQPALTHIVVEDVYCPAGTFAQAAIAVNGTSGAGITDLLIRNCYVGASTQGGGYALSVNGLYSSNMIKVQACDFSENSVGSLPILFTNGGQLYYITATPGWNAQGFTNDYPSVPNGTAFESPYPDTRNVYVNVPSGTTVTNITLGVWYNGAPTRTFEVATNLVGSSTAVFGPYTVPFNGSFYAAWTGGTAPTFKWQGT